MMERPRRCYLCGTDQPEALGFSGGSAPQHRRLLIGGFAFSWSLHKIIPAARPPMRAVFVV